MSRKRLSVVMVAAECAPFAKAGGLGDVIGSLPQALSKHNVLISVVVPRYGFIRLDQLKKVTSFPVEHRLRSERVTVYSTARGKVTYYFIDHPYLATEQIYYPPDQSKSAPPVPDTDRFSFFSRAAAEYALMLKPDLIHCHDWHSALVPTVIDECAVARHTPFIPTILTIHNIASQGSGSRTTLAEPFGLHRGLEPGLLEDYYDPDNEQLIALKIGILTADLITTVSKTYAREILTPQYGAGLELFLGRRRKSIRGIVNGIDTALFDPATDASIARHYTRSTVRAGKTQNKRSLQHELRMNESNDILFAAVSRLVTQKGFDLLVESYQRVAHYAHLIVLGTGEPMIEQELKTLARKYPGRVHVQIGFDLKLAQRIYAGADAFLMPSRFEPCGLGQLIAMRYGTIPVVRATGGLKDTVADGTTGFRFTQPNADAFTRALVRTIKLYEKKTAWYTMVKRCMHQDVSWHHAARDYRSLYESLL